MNDPEIRRFVSNQLAALDEERSEPGWRQRARGMGKGEALAMAPRRVIASFTVDPDEMRVLRRLARERGIAVNQYLRRAVGTAMVADGVDPAVLPLMLENGPL